MKFKQTRVKGGSSHDYFKAASSERRMKFTQASTRPPSRHCQARHCHCGRRTPEGGTGAQCATPSPLQRVRRSATGSHTACRIDCFLSQEADASVSLAARVLARGCMCAFEAARSGQNSSCYRRLRPNRLLNSPSFVDVPDETVTALGVCQGVYSHILGQDDTACQWASRRAQQGALVCGA